MASLTRFGFDGVYMRRAGSFAGKTEVSSGPHPVGILTRFGWDGVYMRLAGSFAGKTASEEPPVTTTTVTGGGWITIVRGRRGGQESPDERRARIFAEMADEVESVEARSPPKKLRRTAIGKIERIAKREGKRDAEYASNYAEYAAALARIRKANDDEQRMEERRLAMAMAEQFAARLMLRIQEQQALAVLLLLD